MTKTHQWDGKRLELECPICGLWFEHGKYYLHECPLVLPEDVQEVDQEESVDVQ